MIWRGLSVVVLIALVILAGCVGGSAPAADDSSEDADGSDGIDAGGDVTLVENRTAVLRDAGTYTSVWEMAFDTEGERVGGTTYTHAVDYENRRSNFGMRLISDGEVTTESEIYYADGTRYTRYGTGEEATYHVGDYEFAPQDTLFPVESSITSANDLEAFSRVGTETYDGVTVTRYERTDRPAWVNAQAGDDTEFTWTSFDYVVLVDEDGLVRYESWGGDGVDDEGVEHTMTFSFALTGVGATVVEEPEWLATADERAN